MWYDRAADGFRRVPDTDTLMVSHLHQTRSGTLLITTEGQGTFAIADPARDRTIEPVVATPDIQVQAFYEDEAGLLYAATGSEVIVFRMTGLRLDSLRAYPVTGTVYGLCTDPAQGMCYLASENGLWRIDTRDPGAQPRCFTQGLPGLVVSSIGQGSGRVLWLGTPQGLVSFDMDRETFRTYSRADGAASHSYEVTSSLRTRAGALWFGGSEGLTVVPAGAPAPDVPTPARLLLTDILVNDAAAPWLRCAETGAAAPSEIRRLVLPYSQHTVSFTLAAVDYSDPAAARLEVRLTGRDPGMVPQEAATGRVRYARLPPGTYYLDARAANSDGHWSDNERLLELTIRAPWYQTWWFRLLATLLLLGLFVAFYRLRIGQVERREVELKQREAEFRQREAEIQLQLAETRMAVLRMQMNPHFIFNSLTSIKAYMLSCDVDTAAAYLQRFAKLMRLILDYAAEPHLSLAQEIELLELYIQTEALRFAHTFTYAFEVDPSLDQDIVILPTMILQPFVENAIQHGLGGKTHSDGHIALRFWREDEALHIEVGDNGSGRPVPTAGPAPGTHRSRALEIARERLALFEQETGLPASYHISDLTSDDGQARGTLVHLTLPYLV
ncbi:MAG: hypothetical protein OHK0039_15300 [Bacteroidia bacterium]